MRLTSILLNLNKEISYSIVKKLCFYTGGLVNFDKSSSILQIEFANKSSKNALSGSMMVEFEKIISQIEINSEFPNHKAAVLSGQSGYFCAGGDLNTVQNICNQQGGIDLSEFMHDVMTRFRKLPILTFADIAGGALGGGAEIALACDFRLVRPSARIGFVQGNFSITPGFGAGTRLVELVGPTIALDLLTTGRLIDAEDAVDIGLASAVISTDRELTSFIEERTKFSSDAISGFKELINAALDLSPSDALRAEKRIFQQRWGNELHKSVVEKYLSKR